jgi:hypothetical protein
LSIIALKKQHAEFDAKMIDTAILVAGRGGL